MIQPQRIDNPKTELRLLSAIAMRGKFTDNNTAVLDDQDWYILTDKQVTAVFERRKQARKKNGYIQCLPEVTEQVIDNYL